MKQNEDKLSELVDGPLMVLVVLCWSLLGFTQPSHTVLVQRHSARWYFSLSFDAPSIFLGFPLEL